MTGAWRRAARCVPAVLAAGLLAGCGGGDDAPDARATASSAPASVTPVPEIAAPPFPAAQFLAEDYKLVSAEAMTLVDGQPQYQVVISENPDAGISAEDIAEDDTEDSASAEPRARGTQNLQVFAHRGGTWTEVFNAGAKVVPHEFQADFGAPPEIVNKTPDAVLNQRHWTANVEASVVRFAADHPALVIYGENKYNPHVLGTLAVVDFGTGKANLDHFELAQDLGKPIVVETEIGRVLEVPNFWYPWLQGGDPQKYIQSVGLSENEGVTVLSDSRPFVGAWVAADTGPGVMVSRVLPGSPADNELDVGDRITSVNGNDPAQALGPDLLALQPGETVTFAVVRGGQNSEVEVVLSDMSKAPTIWETPKPATIGVTVARPTGRPGLALTGVEAGSPAAQAGLKAGDVLQRVGQVPTGLPSDLDAALSGRAGERIEVEVQSADGTTRMVRLVPKLDRDSKGNIKDDGTIALL